MTDKHELFSWVYTDKVKDHFLNPKNILEDPNYEEDGKGIVGSMACGDQMLVLIRVKDDIIQDIRWKTYGCASAIASTSMMSEMVKGMSLEEAYMLTPQKITSELGGLPEHKFHCSVLGDKALRAAIDDYLKRKDRDNPYSRQVAQIVCECKNVTDQKIEQLVRDDEITTMEELQNQTGLGTVCGNCKEKAERMLHDFLHMYGK